MAYSAAGDRRHSPFTTTAAPPPTPSTQPTHISNSNEAAEALSHLLHRLPPSLSFSLPSRLRASPSSSSTTTVSPPSISLAEPTSSLHSNLISASQLGFFQLTHHPITSELANSAESDSLSLFNLPPDQKNLVVTQNWPLGYDANNEDEDEDAENRGGESFVLDSDCSTESTELELVHLKEFTRALEKLGLEVVEAVASSTGFENPIKSDPSRVCSQMWISKSTSNNDGKEKEGYSGRFYPYVVGLHYQMRCQKYSMLADSGWVSVSPQVDSVLVTLGDIAQVWSNGKLKKVRGRPTPIVGDKNDNGVSAQCITMSLLITLPVDSMVFPLSPSNLKHVVEPNSNDDDENEVENSEEAAEEKWVFNAFHFEDYAWRVYHERLLQKDSLLRYRV